MNAKPPIDLASEDPPCQVVPPIDRASKDPPYQVLLPVDRASKDPPSPVVFARGGPAFRVPGVRISGVDTAEGSCPGGLSCKPVSRIPSVALCVLLWLLTVPFAGTVSGREIWTGADGDSALELGAFYKTLAAGFVMRDGLVEGTEALAALVPGYADILPNYGATTSHSSRIWARYLLGGMFELQAGWQLGALVASDPVLTRGATIGPTVPVSGTQGASRRLVDLDTDLANKGSFVLRHDLDLLAARVNTSFASIVVGRQIVSWGSGRLWNPTDLLSPFAPTDIDREVRRGVDAVRLSLALDFTAQLDFMWLAQEALDDQGGVARLRFNLAGVDFAPSVAKYVRDVVVGLDVSGDLGPLGAHIEAAWTKALDADESGISDQFIRAVAGVDWRLAEDLIVVAEYYFNGWGASDPGDYMQILTSTRVVRGEVFGGGRHYGGLVAVLKLSSLLTLQTTILSNLADPSAMLIPVLEYWAEQSVLLRAGAYIPLGLQPDSAPLRSLTAEDVNEQNQAWLEASSSLGLRSEYGASPFGLFIQLAIYL